MYFIFLDRFFNHAMMKIDMNNLMRKILKKKNQLESF